MSDGGQLKTLSGHEDEVTTSLFSPKDQIILTASKDLKAILWNFNGEQLFQLVGHNLAVNCGVFSQDGNVCYTGSNDLSCRIWSTVTGQCIGILKGNRKITSLYVDDY